MKKIGVNRGFLGIIILGMVVGIVKNAGGENTQWWNKKWEHRISIGLKNNSNFTIENAVVVIPLKEILSKVRAKGMEKIYTNSLKVLEFRQNKWVEIPSQVDEKDGGSDFLAKGNANGMLDDSDELVFTIEELGGGQVKMVYLYMSEGEKEKSDYSIDLSLSQETILWKSSGPIDRGVKAGATTMQYVIENKVYKAKLRQNFGHLILALKSKLGTNSCLAQHNPNIYKLGSARMDSKSILSFIKGPVRIVWIARGRLCAWNRIPGPVTYQIEYQFFSRSGLIKVKGEYTALKKALKWKSGEKEYAYKLDECYLFDIKDIEEIPERCDEKGGFIPWGEKVLYKEKDSESIDKSWKEAPYSYSIQPKNPEWLNIYNSETGDALALFLPERGNERLEFGNARKNGLHLRYEPKFTGPGVKLDTSYFIWVNDGRKYFKTDNFYQVHIANPPQVIIGEVEAYK